MELRRYECTIENFNYCDTYLISTEVSSQIHTPLNFISTCFEISSGNILMLPSCMLSFKLLVRNVPIQPNHFLQFLLTRIKMNLKKNWTPRVQQNWNFVLCTAHQELFCRLIVKHYLVFWNILLLIRKCFPRTRIQMFFSIIKAVSDGEYNIIEDE